MIRALILSLFVVAPAFAAAHTGDVAARRSMPELSDIALFVFAALALWFVRRAMRARFRKQAAPTRED